MEVTRKELWTYLGAQIAVGITSVGLAWFVSQPPAGVQMTDAALVARTADEWQFAMGGASIVVRGDDVEVASSKDGRWCLTIAERKPAPEPEPVTPTPTPEPQPPQPTAKASFVTIVSDVDEITPEMSRVITSRVLRDNLAGRGIEFDAYDRDQHAGEIRGRALDRYLSAGLPVLIVQSRDGRVIKAIPVPDNVEAVLTAIGE